jgi:hypothetical protein
MHDTTATPTATATARAEPLQQLALIESTLARFRDQACPASTLADTARAQTALLAALPPRYGEVLLGLLDRLESSALFSEESCSFSQKDLVANLEMWVGKAAGTLQQSRASGV